MQILVVLNLFLWLILCIFSWKSQNNVDHCCTLNADAIEFPISCLFSASQHHDWGFLSFLQKQQKHRICAMVFPNCGWVTIFLATPSLRSWWSQWVINHSWQLVTGSSWWRWWSDTFVCNLRKVKTAFICQLWGFVGEISLQSHRYVEWLLYNVQGTSGQSRFFLQFYFFKVPS